MFFTVGHHFQNRLFIVGDDVVDLSLDASYLFELVGDHIWSNNVYSLASLDLVTTRQDISPKLWFWAKDGLVTYFDADLTPGYIATTTPSTGAISLVYTCESDHTIGHPIAPLGVSDSIYVPVNGPTAPTDAVRKIASGGAGSVTDYAMPANSRPRFLTYKVDGSDITLWSTAGNGVSNLYAIDASDMTAIYDATYDNDGITCGGLDYYAPLDQLVVLNAISYVLHDVASQTSAAKVTISAAPMWSFDASRYGFWGIKESTSRLYFHDIDSGVTTEESFHDIQADFFPGYAWQNRVFASSAGYIFIRGSIGGVFNEFVYIPDSLA